MDSFQKNKLVYLIPAMFEVFLILITPIYPLIFDVTAQATFTRGICHWAVHFSVLVYTLISFCLVVSNGIRGNANQATCMVAALISLILGILVNEYFPAELLMEPFATFALLLVYNTIENPMLYLSSTCSAFNEKAFHALVNQDLNKHKEFYCIGATLSNLNTFKSYYERQDLVDAIDAFSQFLQREFSECNVFYVNDTFLLTSTKPIDYEEGFKKIENRVSKPFIIGSLKFYFHTSCFIVNDTSKFSSASQIVSACDLINKQIIKRDEDGVYRVGSSAIEYLEHQKKIQDVVERSINNKKFRIYFQPIISSSTHKVAGVEALCRLNDTELGFVPPSDFIPIAEKTGGILPIGFQTFELICEYVATHDLEAMGIGFINVNISPVQYQDVMLVDKYYEIAQKYDVDFSLFVFEITETVEDTSIMFEQQLSRFIEKGASVSLDDFGSGASDIKRLVTCPITSAKLDMSLVWDYFDGKNEIILSAIDLFKSENLSIVAEGVEDKKMAEELGKLGCEYLQGFHYSKALPFDEFDEYVAKVNG